MGTKLGRPFSDNPKRVELKTRVTYDEYEKVMKFAKKRNITIAAVLRMGLLPLLENEEK